MRRMLAVALTFAVVLPAAAAKVTTDPNKATAAPGADPRLSQKITYLGGYKRLHSIAEELTKRTGVTIRAGESAQDWRVRDIPLIVCVQDMPLERLLKTVAQTAHVTFARDAATKVLSGDKAITNAKAAPTYRFYRTKAQRDDIASALDARAQAKRKLGTWAWDTLVSYAGKPDASAQIASSKGDGTMMVGGDGGVLVLQPAFDGALIRKLAAAIAALGPDARAKFVAGDEVNLWVKNNPAVTALYDHVVANSGISGVEGDTSKEIGWQPKEPTEQQRAEAYFAIKLVNCTSPREDACQCEVYGIPVGSGDYGLCMSTRLSPVKCAEAVAAVKSLGLPQPPDIGPAFDDATATPDPALKRLGEPDDWKAKPLNEKIALDRPVSEHPLTRAGLLSAVCKASGLNIVCEDFESHKSSQFWGNLLHRESDTPASILRILLLNYGEALFYNEDSQLMVGWADNWRKHHQALVPERFLADIRTKRESRDGAELDDVAGLWDLTQDQLSEWVTQTPGWDGFYFPGGATAAMWRIYNTLSPEQKVIAKSPDGLPVASLGAESVMKLYNQTKRETEQDTLAGWCSEEEPHTKLRREFFSKAELVGKLVLKVTEKPSEGWTVSETRDGVSTTQYFAPGPDGPYKHNYEIALTDPSAAEDKLKLHAPWSAAFPLFDSLREAELAKKAESNAAAK